MQQQSIREWQVGPHHVLFEPPNLVVVRWKGEVLEEHVDGIYGHLDRIESPRYWMLSDVSEADTPDARVRARLSKTEETRRIEGIAVIVSSHSKRAVMGMLLRAVNFLTKTQVKPEFFADEAAARAWIAAERQRLDRQ